MNKDRIMGRGEIWGAERLERSSTSEDVCTGQFLEIDGEEEGLTRRMAPT